MLSQMILFGMAGLGLEVLFTSVTRPDAFKRIYQGYASSLWFVGYALTPVIIDCVPPRWPWYERGTIYLVAIYLIEFGGNWVIKWAFGETPSEKYYRRGWNLYGLISLEPLRILSWFVAGLFLESLR